MTDAVRTRKRMRTRRRMRMRTKMRARLKMAKKERAMIVQFGCCCVVVVVEMTDEAEDCDEVMSCLMKDQV